MLLPGVLIDLFTLCPLTEGHYITVLHPVILFSGQNVERYGMDFSFPLSGVERGDAKASLTETTQRGSGKDTRRFGDLA